MPGPKGGLGLLALGTDQGHVSLWDLTRGVLAARLGEVRDVTFPCRRDRFDDEL